MANLNQLYSNALGAFSQAAGMNSGMQGVVNRINQNPNIQGGMNPVGWTGTGIATIPQSGGSTLGSRSPKEAAKPEFIPPSIEPGSEAAIARARKDQSSHMASLLGTDEALSLAAGRDISGFGRSIYSPYNDPSMSNADWIKAMKALQAKVDAGNATPEEIQLLNKTSSEFSMPPLNPGGTTGIQQGGSSPFFPTITLNEGGTVDTTFTNWLRESGINIADLDFETYSELSKKYDELKKGIMSLGE